MADLLAVADWKKNVNSLLGLLHKKTGMTEALTKYETVRKTNGATPMAKVESLEAVLKAIAKTADAHKSNKKAQDHLKGMKSQAEKALKESAAVAALFEKGVAFKEMLGSPGLWPFFMEFCRTEHSAENFEFWLAMQKSPDFARAEALAVQCLDPKGKKGLNLASNPHKDAAAILGNVDLSKEEKLKRLLPLLNKAVKDVEVNMADTWLRFIFSEVYIRMVARHRGFKSWV